MSNRMRYGDFLSAVRLRQRAVDYADVVAHDRAHPRRTRLRPVDVHRLLTPYIRVRFVEQLRAVAPLAAMLALFLVAALRADVADAGSIALGIVAVMVGLMFFMEGVKHGLMPFAENIGYGLPGRSTRSVVLTVAFLLGAAATFAEPAIGALRTAGSSVQAASAPLLYDMLNHRAELLVAAVALGVGAAVAVGMVRIVYGWGLKPVVLAAIVPALGLTWYVGSDPQLAPVLGLAWDCGGITTGPVTVPLVLAMGIGVAGASGDADNPLAGFGIVTLASIFPAITVMLLAIGLQVHGTTPPLAATDTTPLLPPWYTITPFAEAGAACRAILPLVGFLWLVQRFVLRQPLGRQGTVTYGIVLALAGMILFNLGLTFGLVALGDQAGTTTPNAFSATRTGAALYPYVIGVALTLAFAAAIGFGATLAEPALSAMGYTVESLTDGAFSRRLLVRAVAVGVAGGTSLGVAKIVFALPMLELLIASYVVAITLTALSTEEYVNLAWDSAGVTTGPVTVPLILSLGLGLGEAVHASEGFGILAMASVGPIVSVLAVGLWIRFRAYVQATREQGT